MATFYLDPENGNDANDGTTFANRWKTLTTGATGPRTAPGDIIRVIAASGAVNTGISGTWSNGPIPAGLTLGSNSTTNAVPVVVTYNSHGLSTGDFVQLANSTVNTSANGIWKINVLTSNTFQLLGSSGNATGSNGTITKANSAVVAFTNPPYKIIENCNLGWTAATNVSVTVNSSSFGKEGRGSNTFTLAAAFGSGMIAYRNLGVTLDLSSYQQLTFWLGYNNVSPSGVSLRLCSDTLGAVPVNTFNLPIITNTDGTINFKPIVVDNGSALGSAIKSVSLFASYDPGTLDFYLDNLVACKAPSAPDCLTLHHLISKNTADETWYTIRSFHQDCICLDHQTDVFACSPFSNHTRGYTGTTETVLLYTRMPIRPALGTNSSSTINLFQETQLTITGGWNRTDMSTQTGETWIDGQCGWSLLFNVNSTTSDHTFENLHATRYDTAFYMTNAQGHTYNNCSANCCRAGFYTHYQSTSANTNYINCKAYNNGEIGFLPQDNTIFTNCKAYNTVSPLANQGGFVTTVNDITQYVTFVNCSAKNNNYGFKLDYYRDSKLINCDTNYNTYAIDVLNCNIQCYNCIFNEAAPFRIQQSGHYKQISSYNHNQVANAHYFYLDDAEIRSETSVRHTASGLAWKLTQLGTPRDKYYPIILPIATIAVRGGQSLTVKGWFRRTSISQSGKLVVPDYQIGGPSGVLDAYMTAAIDTWEELSVSWTPAENGVVRINAESYGVNNHSVYVDDMSIT